MREVKIKVLQFKELDKEVQEKLIEKEMESQTDMYMENSLIDDMEYEAEELLTKHFGDKNFDFKKVYYDLSCSQGSGAMIVYNVYEEGVKKILLEKKILTKKQLDRLQQVKLEVWHSSSCHYYHENSFDYDFDYCFGARRESYDSSGAYEYNGGTDKRIMKTFEKLDKFFEEELKELIYNINVELTRRVRELADYTPSEEECVEYLEEQEYLKNGETFMS